MHIVITIDTEGGDQIAWEIREASGAETLLKASAGSYTAVGSSLHQVTGCLFPGDYVFEASDQGGDGWFGGSTWEILFVTGPHQVFGDGGETMFTIATPGTPCPPQKNRGQPFLTLLIQGFLPAFCYGTTTSPYPAFLLLLAQEPKRFFLFSLLYA